MRITGWEVERFGALRDAGVRDVPPGLAVVHGPNASGKTTLLAFLQRTLFGHPHGNRKGVNHYEPLDGTNQRGGRVFLDAGGPVTVERYAGRGSGLRVLLPDETVAGEEALRERTGGCDAELFGAVYAFGLTELTELDTLSDDAVRDRLFDASVRGAARSARAAIAGFEDRAAALWGPRTRTREIDEDEAELRRIDSELAEARREVHGYGQRLAAEREAASEVARLDDELAEARLAQRRAERLLGAWPVWVRKTEAEHALRDLGDVPSTAGAAVDDLDGAREEQRVRLDALDALDVQLARARDDLDAALTELGQGWDRQRLDAFDASVAVRGTLRTWEERLGEARRAAADAAQAHETASAEAEEVEEHASAARQRSAEATGGGGATVADRAELERRAEALAELRVAVAERDTAQAELSALAQTGTGAGWAAAGAGTLALAAGGFAVWLATLDQVAAAGLAGLLALALAAGTWGLSRASRRGATTAQQSAQRRRDAAAHRVAHHAAELGVADDPAEPDTAVEEAATTIRPAEVERRARTLERERERRAHLDRLDEEAHHAEEAAKRAHRAVETARQRRGRASDSLDALVVEWQAWCAEHGLDRGLDPGTAHDVLVQVERARERQDRLAELETEHEATARAVNDYAARAAAVLASDDREVSVPADRASLRSQIDEVRDLATRVRERDRLSRAVATAEAELAEHLGEGPQADALRAALASGDKARWEAERDEAARRSAELTEQRDAALEERYEAQRRRAELETSARTVELEHERERVRAARDAKVHKWRVAVLAGALVGATLERFERERQPAVLRRASELFATVTDGAYARVLQQDDDVLVADTDDRPWPVTTLSRGTREQLYLCLRLALAEDLGARHVPMPFVMDDVLVNFDPRRAAQVAHLLAEVAQRSQVLYFTCHPHTVDLLTEVGAGAVYDLSAGGVVDARP